MAGQDDSLRHLTDHPAIWRGRDARLSGETLATGNTQLDALLPQGGWPLSSVTEIRIDHVGSGEMTLLLPAIAGDHGSSRPGCV